MSTNLNVKLITRNLGDELIAGMQHATGIYIMTSFLMQSGVNLLAPHLKKALDRGAEVKMLAGDYLYITQPEGLRKLLSIDDRLEARLWRSMGTSFHPKAYLFDYENGEGLLIVGSSNFSFSALKTGYEWNLAMNAQAEPYTFQNAMDQFMENLYHDATLPLTEDTISLYEDEYLLNHRKNPELQRQVIQMEEAEADVGEVQVEAQTEGKSTDTAIQPRPAQAMALDALDATIEEEYDRAMMVMATGLGKTYLAAFLAKRYRRVLFVAHREEILQQAARSFRHVLPERSHGLYNGQSKDSQSDCVFASIYTLGMKKHREAFSPDDFDLIVIDEFHHAAARSYRSVLDYFRPQFMLGITATPDRMDGQDVYALCGGNVAYRIHFIEAIRREWLAPFQYYGVHDETDYSGIRWLGTHYDEEQLLAAQLREEYAERVYEAWAARRQTRTIAFCSSIQQADYLNDYFRIRGSRTLSLHSRTKEMRREEAIRRLDAGEMDVLFTVDLFNEGTDIPSVDTLLFVRPTESLTVFTQQVGRGLRLAEGKSHCVIIDLIGNYRNADVKLRLFSEHGDENEGGKKERPTGIPTVPESCSIQLETAVVNLLEELSRKRAPYREKLHRDFLDLKSELGRIPTYLELHLQGRSVSKGYRDEFGSYVGFLNWTGLLDEREQQVYEHYEAWLRDAEKTAMARSYKMVVLAYMLERGVEYWSEPVTAEETAAFFHSHLTEKEYRKRIDFSGKEAKAMWTWNEQTQTKVAKLIADMPMSKWAGAKGSQVEFADGKFGLAFEVAEEDKELLHRWTREICEYRLHVHFERRVQSMI